MWMIEITEGVIYDKKSHELRTVEKDAYIASVYVNAKRELEICFGVDTNFQSDSGKIKHVGWNLSTDRMGGKIRIKDEGGTLDYHELRNNYCNIPIFPEKFTIRIKLLKGCVVPCVKKKS